MSFLLTNLIVPIKIALATELLRTLVTLIWLYFYVHNLDVITELMFSTKLL